MEIKNFFKKTVDNNNNEVYNLDDTIGRDDTVLVKVLLENDVKRFTITEESTGTLRRIAMFMEAGFKPALRDDFTAVQQVEAALFHNK